MTIINPHPQSLSNPFRFPSKESHICKLDPLFEVMGFELHLTLGTPRLLLEDTVTLLDSDGKLLHSGETADWLASQLVYWLAIGSVSFEGLLLRCVGNLTIWCMRWPIGFSDEMPAWRCG